MWLNELSIEYGGIFQKDAITIPKCTNVWAIAELQQINHHITEANTLSATCIIYHWMYSLCENCMRLFE